MKKCMLLFFSLNLFASLTAQSEIKEAGKPLEELKQPGALHSEEEPPLVHPEFDPELKANEDSGSEEKTLDDLLEEIADSSAKATQDQEVYYQEFMKQLALGYQLVEKGAHLIIPATASAVAYLAYNHLAAPCLKSLRLKVVKTKVVTASEDSAPSDDGNKKDPKKKVTKKRSKRSKTPKAKRQKTKKED